MNEIPFLSLHHTHASLRDEMINAFSAVYDSSVFITGNELLSFEKDYASFNQVAFCIGVSNGLDALQISLRTLGIGKGDEVIIPSNTFIATALAVTSTGARPVFVEPDEQTYNIDKKKIEPAITTRTKAIIPVHLYGQACDMDGIISIAKRHSLYVIEDNAQAQGAEWNGQLTGSFGHINATSFYPGKNLGALGDAGSITTQFRNLAQKAIMLRNYGSSQKYKHEIIGYNQRMDEMQAVFLRIKLKYLQEWTIQRQEIARQYHEQLLGTGDLILPSVASMATHVYHLFVIRTNRRDILQNHLLHNRISTQIHYPIPLHLQGAYQSLGFKKGDFPIAETIANTCLSLPLWPGMTEKMIASVTDSIKKYFNG